MAITSRHCIHCFVFALLMWTVLAGSPLQAAGPESEIAPLKPDSGYEASDVRYIVSPVSESRPSRHKKAWKKAWIASWVAFAAVNFLDAHSSAGRRELNPFLRGSDGTFSAGKAALLKAAVGGGFFAFQWWMTRKNPDKDYYKTFTIANSAVAVGLGAVAARNYGVEKVDQQISQSNAHDYLKRQP